MKSPMAGTTHGMLYISHRIDECDKAINSVQWQCDCDCGNSVPLTLQQIKNGRTDCGCINPVRVSSPCKKKTNYRTSTTNEMKLHPIINQFLYGYKPLEDNTYGQSC